ncbi:hypothetical protein CCR94_14155 [Rhodoblastus sphagnicola]|uniref:Uncharacterized protein n=2 Tax=Rhodoblastus sphagnicola TaxID=333368 RepID=A0A2S6N592_9HYPH|nr:hypothetical protein [Rhodoblastus sphagnicola]MBB4197174.1 hypothetical protein [Rhodoblastus sphagnicola]PPQ29790.1 hypothetical protein CCR94_14155 [Rhodoblastus sphagnicola]
MTQKIDALAPLFHGLPNMRKIVPFVFALAAFGLAPASHAGGYYVQDEAVGSVCGVSCLAGQSESALRLELYYTQVYAHDPDRPPLVIVNRPPAYDPPVSARY